MALSRGLKGSPLYSSPKREGEVADQRNLGRTPRWDCRIVIRVLGAVVSSDRSLN